MSIIDKELLSIVMTLKEFRSMLLGASIAIHTDHRNILSIGDVSQRRLRWISYVDEYGPTLKYIEGPKNVIADHFSLMPRSDDQVSPSVGKKSANATDIKGIVTDIDPLDNHHSWIDEIKEIIDCCNCLDAEDSFLNIPSEMDEENPLDMETIKEQQATDATALPSR